MLTHLHCQKQFIFLDDTFVGKIIITRKNRLFATHKEYKSKSNIINKHKFEFNAFYFCLVCVYMCILCLCVIISFSFNWKSFAITYSILPSSACLLLKKHKILYVQTNIAFSNGKVSCFSFYFGSRLLYRAFSYGKAKLSI